jgi:hypothetical protein
LGDHCMVRRQNSMSRPLKFNLSEICI